MAIRITNRFDVARPLDVVWDFLLDPARFVPCMPGARLVRRIDDHSFEGEVGITAGPLAATLRGVIRFDLIDDSQYRVEMSGDARSERGSAAAQMRMTSTLTRLDDSTTRVDVDQTVTLSGALAVLGRLGLVHGLADIVLGRFGRCVQRRLGSPAAGDSTERVS